jgi:predicted Zn-dependent protease
LNAPDLVVGIGHVAARHSSQRQGRSTLVGLGAALAGILTGSGQIAQMGNAIGAGYVQKFSRDQELQADTLGVRYMSRANYDPNAAVTFLRKMQQETRLQAIEAGKDPDQAEQINWMSSHPRTADRVEQAIENAGVTQVSNPIVEQDVYLSKIDGIVFGDDPDQGVIRGRTFVHPALGFEFEVPKGFQIINQPQQVLAQAREGDGLISFGQAKVEGSLRNWFLDHPKAQFEGVERIDVNGMEGATGVTQGAHPAPRLVAPLHPADEGPVPAHRLFDAGPHLPDRAPLLLGRLVSAINRHWGRAPSGSPGRPR